jgi:hypothetical protein
MGIPNARASPKSASLRLFLLSMRRFCGLRSRCRIRCEWQYNSPDVSWCVNFCSASQPSRRRPTTNIPLAPPKRQGGENEKRMPPPPPPHMNSARHASSVNRGNMPPSGPACLNPACRTRRLNHVIHAPIGLQNRFPEHWVSEPKALAGVEVRQPPCCVSADRAVILGANVDALFAYNPAERWGES